MTSTASTGSPATPAGTSAWKLVVLGVVVLGVLAGGSFLLAPTSDGLPPPTSAVNALVGNRWLVGAVRLTALVAGLYVVVSIGVRSWRGEWLKSLGSAVPAVGEGADNVAKDHEQLKERLKEALATVDDLQEELDGALAIIDELLQDEPSKPE